jgi:uncharacterized membrane protein YeiH
MRPTLLLVMLVYIELGSVLAGALSGALHGLRRKFDLVGVLIIAIATALGGGMLRDILLSQGPPIALRQDAYLLTAIAGAIGCTLLASTIAQLGSALALADALSLGLFAIAGLQRAHAIGLALPSALFVGVVAGCGGGLVRDVLSRETPELLTPGHPYATAALLACVVDAIFTWGLKWTEPSGQILGIAACMAMRLVSVRHDWKLPMPPDLTSLRRRDG